MALHYVVTDTLYRIFTVWPVKEQATVTLNDVDCVWPNWSVAVTVIVVLPVAVPACRDRSSVVLLTIEAVTTEGFVFPVTAYNSFSFCYVMTTLLTST